MGPPLLHPGIAVRTVLGGAARRRDVIAAFYPIRWLADEIRQAGAANRWSLDRGWTRMRPGTRRSGATAGRPALSRADRPLTTIQAVRLTGDPLIPGIRSVGLGV